jgi:hypothetical protein
MFRTTLGIGEDGSLLTFYEEIEDEPQEPRPALPVEVWATREFDADTAHAATLALCKGN